MSAVTTAAAAAATRGAMMSRAASSSSSAGEIMRRRVQQQKRVGRAIYRSILRWCDDYGDDDGVVAGGGGRRRRRRNGGRSAPARVAVPLDPIPPITLSPPLLGDATVLSKLASIHAAASVADVTSSSSPPSSPDSLLHVGNGGKDADDGGDPTMERLYSFLREHAPTDAVFYPSHHNRVVIPVKDVESIRNITRSIFRINAVDIEGPNDDDHDEEEEMRHHDIVKKRVALGFEMLKSLNELRGRLDERRRSRESHWHDRDGRVDFDVGQVVQHKKERWRGLVCGWNNRKEEERNENSKGKRNDDAGTIVATNHLKKEDDGRDADDDADDEAGDVEYSLMIDTGDAILYNGIPTNVELWRQAFAAGAREVVTAPQSDLEPLTGPHAERLSRLRCQSVKSKFDRFDTYSSSFVPDERLRYEYPSEERSTADDEDGDDNKTTTTTPHHPSPPSDVSDAETKVVNSVKSFAADVGKDILRVFFLFNPPPPPPPSSSPSSGNEYTDPVGSIARQLGKIMEGNPNSDGPPSLSDQLATEHHHHHHRQQSPRMSDATKKLIHMNKVINDTLDACQSRRKSLRHRDGIRFKPGDIVKHKLYHFRGVVVDRDAQPRVDVSRWDGLQHLRPEDVDEMPFYHVVPDPDDSMRAFGGQRSFRYVCEDNLEECPWSEREGGLGVDLDADWKWDGDRGSYDIPDVVKFKYGESLGENEDATVKCMESLCAAVLQWQMNARDAMMDDLFTMLRSAESVESSIVIEETIKDLWKAHMDDELRDSFDRALFEMHRNKYDSALAEITSVVESDPTFVEGWNKKATIHYLRREFDLAVEATEKTLELEPRHFLALSGYGIIHQDSLGDIPRAVDCFARCLDVQPWSPVSSRLIRCLDLMEEEEGAEEGTAPSERRQ